MVAASKGKSSFVRELLAHGADPNAEDNDNWTALLCAAKEGHYDIVLQLLEHNAEIDHRDMVSQIYYNRILHSVSNKQARTF